MGNFYRIALTSPAKLLIGGGPEYREGDVPSLLPLLGFAGTTFAGAFLLFLVEPLVGRLWLPQAGGAPAVWITCLVFFQTALFVGYLWAHLVAARWGRLGRWIHVGMAALVVLVLPFGTPAPLAADHPPQTQVLHWLTLRIGPAFVVLAATSPVLQGWWSHRLGRNPYPLYAISNAGSLLALLAYPLLIEPAISLTGQARGWAWGYAVFVGGMFVCAALARQPPPAAPARCAPAFDHRRPVPAARRLLWLALAAVPSVLLLAITNHLTIDVAAGPVMWALPLVLYLLSFVCVFGPVGQRCQGIIMVVWLMAVLALGVNLFLAGQTSLGRQVAVAATVLFACCLLCHGELARLRPPAQHVTIFYVWMAAGGALGGLLAGVAAPRLFRGFFELPIGVMAACLALAVSLRADRPTGDRPVARRLLPVGLGLGLPLMAGTVWMSSVTHFKDAHVLSRARGFFGLVQVTAFPDFTVLTHGRIRHGMQWNAPARRREPTMYFATSTAAGKLLGSDRDGGGRRIGVLGLGVGTLATYTRAADTIWFYEIDPDVIMAARTWFTFLSEAAGHTEVVLGDGRAELSRRADHQLDVLVLDAFSSDSVPTHLLTREAFQMYRRVLRPDGILLANVSNLHLAVERVVAGAAQDLGWAFGVYETATDAARGVTKVRWAVVSSDGAAVQARLGPPNALQGAPVLWTDERSSLLSILMPAAVVPPPTL